MPRFYTGPLSVSQITVPSVVPFPSLTTAGATLLGRWNALNATVVGGLVTAMADLSGHGNNMAATGNVPFSSNGYNGNPAVNFTAANTSLLSTSIGSMNSALLFFYAVGVMNSGTTTFGGLMSFAVSAQNDFNGANSIATITRDSGGAGLRLCQGGNVNVALNSITVGNRYRLGMIFNTTSQTYNVLINNAAGTGGSVATPPLSLGPTGTIALGGRVSSTGLDTTDVWDGFMTEGLVGSVTDANGLNSTDQNAIDNYFTSQWGS